jgi:hypothetical protein
MEDKEGAQGDTGETDAIIPFERIAKIGDGEDGENRQGDDLLNRFQLGAREFVGTKTIGRYLEAIFEESDAPTRNYHLPQRRVPVFQVAVPRKSHEDIRNCQKDDRAQGSPPVRSG